MIRLESVSKRYPNGHVAVADLSFEVDAGEICVLVGPSGCGKTTTLRMINRLVEPTGGRIFLADEDVTTTDPVVLRRRLGYVIQQVGLFPHQTIAVNIGTVPRLLGWSRARISTRVDELLQLVGLDPGAYRSRYPAQLSGGERQRVGVARALAADPPVLLMDEPFGAIDPVNRVRLQDEFLRIQRALGTTVVFVTHDIEEAVKMGDRIAVLQVGGRLAQYDTPAEILARPASDMVTDFVGDDRGLTRLRVVPIPRDLPDVPTVRQDEPATNARAALANGSIDWAVVVDEAGILTGEVETTALAGDGTVAGSMRKPGAQVEAGASLADAFSALLLTDEGRVVVVEAGKPTGVLTATDIYRAARSSTAHVTDQEA